MLRAYGSAVEAIKTEHRYRCRAEEKAYSLGLRLRIAKAKITGSEGQIQLLSDRFNERLTHLLNLLSNQPTLNIPSLEQRN